MKIVVAELKNKELKIKKISEKCRSVLTSIILPSKSKIKASNVYKTFFEVFNTEKVLLKEENYEYQIVYNDCRDSMRVDFCKL